jgi:hypothetical protein
MRGSKSESHLWSCIRYSVHELSEPDSLSISELESFCKSLRVDVFCDLSPYGISVLISIAIDILAKKGYFTNALIPEILDLVFNRSHRS